MRQPDSAGGRDLRAVPTLTEVIDEEPSTTPVAAGNSAALTAPAAPAALAASAVPAAPDAPSVPADAADAAVADAATLPDAALARLEARLREAVEPALARLADALVRELRGELAALLGEAVEREAARRRDA